MTTDCTGRHAERGSERELILKAILALAVVAALVVLREVVFA
ncbi:hypothetical protein [Lacisediminihabitans profunda]|nr:hypothetical protein [Lacisediminihabitans profunda]